jgi:hypothetical protein
MFPQTAYKKIQRVFENSRRVQGSLASFFNKKHHEIIHIKQANKYHELLLPNPCELSIRQCTRHVSHEGSVYSNHVLMLALTTERLRRGITWCCARQTCRF